MTTESESFFDKINNKFKGVFTYFSNPNEEVKKTQDNLNKITIECNECNDKKALAEKALKDAKAAVDAEAARVKAAADADAAKGTTGGKSKRKGTRKPNGKKNKKTRRN